MLRRSKMKMNGGIIAVLGCTAAAILLIILFCYLASKHGGKNRKEGCGCGDGRKKHEAYTGPVKKTSCKNCTDTPNANPKTNTSVFGVSMSGYDRAKFTLDQRECCENWKGHNIHKPDMCSEDSQICNCGGCDCGSPTKYVKNKDIPGFNPANLCKKYNDGLYNLNGYSMAEAEKISGYLRCYDNASNGSADLAKSWPIASTPATLRHCPKRNHISLGVNVCDR